MMTTRPPFRADMVGSLLRSKPLADARARLAKGEIDAAALKAVEDAEIRKLIGKQEAIGLKGITDGEFRRAYWHFDFMEKLDGIEAITADSGMNFKGGVGIAKSLRITGKVGFSGHPMLEHFTFLRDNWPSREDLTWLLRAGGLFGDHEVPSHRFNGGEKIVFWGGVLGLGVVVVVSGLVLDMVIPGLDYLRGDMQIAHMVHGVATILMMAMFAGHIYMGTIGMKGAYSAMRTGYVDEAWAKEHHELWYDDIKAGKIPAQRSTEAGQAPVGRPGVQA